MWAVIRWWNSGERVALASIKNPDDKKVRKTLDIE